MKILVPRSLSSLATAHCKSTDFDLCISQTDNLQSLFEQSAKEQRVLFMDAEKVNGQEAAIRNAYGVIALGKNARTSAGFQKSVIPNLIGAANEQFSHHITVFHGKGPQEIVHIAYENKDIRESITIPRGTNEYFLHFGSNGLEDLNTIGIMLAGITRTVRGYCVSRQPPLFSFLGIVLKGALHIDSGNGEEMKLGAGTTFIIPSHTSSTYSAQSPTDFLWFHIRDNTFSGDIVGKGIVHSPLVHGQELIDYATHFSNESRNQRPDNGVAMTYLASLIRLQILRIFESFGSEFNREGLRERINRAVREMAQKADQDWSVNTLAGYAGLSVSQLYREVRREFDKSPGDIINEVRLRHASELLLHSSYKLHDIAEMTGYSDAFSFSRAFKRFTGRSPSSFRNG